MAVSDSVGVTERLQDHAVVTPVLENEFLISSAPKLSCLDVNIFIFDY